MHKHSLLSYGIARIKPFVKFPLPVFNHDSSQLVCAYLYSCSPKYQVRKPVRADSMSVLFRSIICCSNLEPAAQTTQLIEAITISFIWMNTFFWGRIIHGNTTASFGSVPQRIQARKHPTFQLDRKQSIPLASLILSMMSISLSRSIVL